MIHISQPAKFGLLNQANNNFRRPPEGQNNYPSCSLVEVTNTSFAYFSFSTPKQQMFKTKKIFLLVNQRAHLSSSHLLLKRGSGTNETLLKNLPHGRTITKQKINKKQGKYLTSDLLKTASSSDFYATFGLTAAVSET